jgi:hypothetical protein
MDLWLKIFVVVAAAAIIVQMGILVAMYMQFRQMNERMTRIATDLHAKAEPVLVRLQLLLDDTRPRITSIVGDTAEITHLARGQALKVDRVFTEAVDRLRLQIIRADQILTGALESIEDAGTEIRRTVTGPVQKATALIRGIQAGLDFFRASRRSPERSREHQEEGLFI